MLFPENLLVDREGLLKERFSLAVFGPVRIQLAEVVETVGIKWMLLSHGLPFNRQRL
jgi:hypothetical protein